VVTQRNPCVIITKTTQHLQRQIICIPKETPVSNTSLIPLGQRRPIYIIQSVPTTEKTTNMFESFLREHNFMPNVQNMTEISIAAGLGAVALCFPDYVAREIITMVNTPSPLIRDLIQAFTVCPGLGAVGPVSILAWGFQGESTSSFLVEVALWSWAVLLLSSMASVNHTAHLSFWLILFIVQVRILQSTWKMAHAWIDNLY